MKVLVINNMAPFVWGGAEELAAHLVKNLRLQGADAQLMRIPFKWEPAERLLEEMLMCSNLQVTAADRVIALKFPAYLVPHPNKVLWLLHQYRQAYDLWDAGKSNIPDTQRGREIRSAIRLSDDACFRGCPRIFTNHATTADRLKKYNGFDAEVLMPPLNDPEIFTGGDPGHYIFVGGRVNRSKRQHLMVEAMQFVRSDIRLIIAGPPDTEHDARSLRALCTRLNVADRVELDLRFLTRTELAHHVNHALAVAYLPYDEDSVGYVTMEAFQAAKPVITVDDSGGVLDLVRDGETGRVPAPDPKRLAESIDAFAADRSRSIEMGNRAREAWQARGINWPVTIERLLS